MEPWQQWSLVATAVGALIGVIWKLVTLALDRIEKRLDEHIAEDIKVHERVVRLETRGETDAKEITELRERTRGMKHDILGEVTKTMLGWYNDIIERLIKLMKP
jgi:low affinity Fe/Cu permease